MIAQTDRLLADLQLDPTNPRFGVSYEKGEPDQITILDNIADTYGIEDLLSSIALNGYYGSEPLVGIPDGESGKVIVVEGNRRLAACLILMKDPRAKNQTKRLSAYKSLIRHPFDTLPVIVYPTRRELLPYLGVRHIVGSSPWDSFAKAAWVSKVVADGGSKLTLRDIALMIGDKHGTIARMLEGFYFVQQLVDTGRFVPRESLRKGRGSSPEFPFSWIYTILGYRPARTWLDFREVEDSPTKTPVPENRLDRAEQLIQYMFGNSTKKIDPVISDSRELGELAKALLQPEVLALLGRGVKLSVARFESRPVEDRLATTLEEARYSLNVAWKLLGGKEVTSTTALALISPSKDVSQLAANVRKRVAEIAAGAEEIDG
jgi:hypothetical protein